MNSGAAPTDLATALLAIRDQVIPPTPAPHTTPNLVTGRPRPWKPAPALILARGKSGHNTAMIVQPASSTHG
jgi:act minimal PKS chain-length factor (CLF/KS beta)